MNHQTLERLLIDDALGALPADQHELLTAYTSIVGSDTDRIAWRRLANLARLAIPTEPARTVPQFPSKTIQMRQFWHAGTIGLAAAAVLLLGMAIGTRFFARANSPIANPSVAVSNPQPASQTAEVTDFWSSSRLVAIAMERKPRPASSVQWSTMFDNSRIGAMP